MRALKILTLFLILVAFSPLITSDSAPPQLETKPQASVIILPHDVYLVFSTRKNAQHEYPDPFRAIEVDGHILLGYTFLCGDKENGGDKKRTTILVMVDNPEMYTRTYVERLAKMLYVINTPGYDITKLDLLLDKQPSDWEVAGILDHELSHLSDDRKDWYGRQRVMLFDLFPHVVPQPPAIELKANPWAAMKALWPKSDTHPGYSKRVY